MSFMQDLSAFLGEVKAVSDELDNTKREVISSLVDSATQTQATLTDTAISLSTTVQQAGDDIKQSTTIQVQSPPESPSNYRNNAQY